MPGPCIAVVPLLHGGFLSTVPFFDLDPAHLYGGVLLVLAAYRRATPLLAAFGLRPRRLPALMWVRVRRWLQQHRLLLGS